MPVLALSNSLLCHHRLGRDLFWIQVGWHPLWGCAHIHQGLRRSSHSYQGNFMLMGLIECTDIADTVPAKPSVRDCTQEGKSQLLFQLMLVRHRAQGHLPWCDCNGETRPPLREASWNLNLTSGTQFTSYLAWVVQLHSLQLGPSLWLRKRNRREKGKGKLKGKRKKENKKRKKRKES